MTDLELDVRESFERIFPVSRVAADWEEVLGRAGASRRSGTGSVLRWRVFAVAAAILVAALLVTPFGVGARLLDLIRGGAPGLPELGGRPAWSPDGRQIAFLRLGERRRPIELSRYEVHVVNADGRGDRTLARNSIGWSSPAWSPDGQTLAYVNVRGGRHGRGGGLDIHVVNADGSAPRRLARAGLSPTWSPDGERLAFLTPRGWEDIHVVNADGSGRRRLARGMSPAWSPDGRHLALLRGGASSSDIYVVDVDGTGQRRLTRGLGHVTSLEWSPDGERIVFQRARDRRWEVHVINTDGSAERTLVGAESAEPAIAYMLFHSSWSPDGQWIAFASIRDGNCDVYVMGADGSDLRRLTRHRAQDGRPVWSPDGRRIAFTSDRGGAHEIWVMNADGSGQRQLTRRVP